MAEEQNRKTGAENVTWNLGDLYQGSTDHRFEADQKGAEERAQVLAQQFKGRISTLGEQEMERLLSAYESIVEMIEKPSTFAALDWSGNTEDPARGALLQRLTEQSSRLAQILVFVALEWANAPEEHARKLMESPLLAKWRHWLEITRRYRPFLLTEAEEKLLREKAVTGREAWVRYFEETQGATLYAWEGRSVPQQEILNKLYNPDREVRHRAADALTAGLRGIQRSATYVFNTLLADKASDDRLRGYPAWISARNLDNQVNDATVEALVSAVTSRYDIVARYYRLKKKIMGTDELFDYDRYAPIAAQESFYTWSDARQIVLSAYRKFHPRMAEIASLFFDKGWIDAGLRRGKRGGAFSSPCVPSVHPYVLLSYQGTTNDVMTLAHELGHGVHQYLARDRGILQQSTPLTTAETASTFGESLVFHDMYAREENRSVRLAMLVREIESAFATIFRQIAMNRFEQGIHTARRAEGELTLERFSHLWLDTQKQMFGGSVTLREDYGIWWSYIYHFLFAPGYVYAYAFGELLVRALYSRYQKAGPEFADAYLSVLAAGGSEWPHKLMAGLHVDLTDPGFWAEGLGLLEDMVRNAEDLAGHSA